ncbi:hypothetical protein BC830DRAFT_497425 [Chytriomyces sp. MP71]|nr:hypothetical protein BC830DRAFT_497425 [Chytriomyces sp. MP71]
MLGEKEVLDALLCDDEFDARVARRQRVSRGWDDVSVTIRCGVQCSSGGGGGGGSGRGVVRSAVLCSESGLDVRKPATHAYVCIASNGTSGLRARDEVARVAVELVDESELVSSLLVASHGLASSRFALDTYNNSLVLSLPLALRMPALSLETTKQLVTPFLILGTHVARLDRIANIPSQAGNNAIFLDPTTLLFCHSLRVDFLALVHSSILAISDYARSNHLGIIKARDAIRTLAHLAHLLARICGVSVYWDKFRHRILDECTHPHDGSHPSWRVYCITSTSVSPSSTTFRVAFPPPGILVCRLYDQVTRLDARATTATGSSADTVVRSVLVRFLRACAGPFVRVLGSLVGVLVTEEDEEQEEVESRFATQDINRTWVPDALFEGGHLQNGAGVRRSLSPALAVVNVRSALAMLDDPFALPSFLPTRLLDAVRHSGLCLELLQRHQHAHPLLAPVSFQGGKAGLRLSVPVHPAEVAMFQATLRHHADAYLRESATRERRVRANAADAVERLEVLAAQIDSERKLLASRLPRRRTAAREGAKARRAADWRDQVRAFLDDVAAYRTEQDARTAEAEAVARAREAMEEETARAVVARAMGKAEEVFATRVRALEARELRVEFAMRRGERVQALRGLIEGEEEWFEGRARARKPVEDAVTGVEDTEKGQMELEVELPSRKDDVALQMVKEDEDEGEESFVSALDLQEGSGTYADGAAPNEVTIEIAVDGFSSQDGEEEFGVPGEVLADLVVSDSYQKAQVPEREMLEGTIPTVPRRVYLAVGDEGEQIAQLDPPSVATKAVMVTTDPIAPKRVENLSRILTSERTCPCHGVAKRFCPSPVAHLPRDEVKLGEKGGQLGLLSCTPLDVILETTLYQAIYYRCDLISLT